MSETAELAKLKRERDLYQRLLDLGRQQELDQFLRDALELIVGATDARQGYVELHGEEQDGAPRWSLAHGFTPEQVEGIRAAISHGIIAEALATGTTVVTPSALADERFHARESVRRGQIRAVLCAPIGDDPPRGVLYLQNRDDGDGFSEQDRLCTETVARHLEPIVDRILARERERQVTDHTAPVRTKLRISGVVGRSRALAASLHQVALVAPLDVNVLLTGDSGTGKSQLARAIHDNSPRAAHPFVTLNCAALPENLVENELFGSAQGGHSTATRPIEGKVAAAEHGTLFLDEVGELSRDIQAKLLLLLHAHEYTPIAGKARKADIRVIAATNTDLQQAVAEKRFRDDLYFRLHVLPIRVPTLAERREDIRELVSFCAGRACERHHLPVITPSPNALRAAEAAEWRGNVRELDHAVEAAVIRAAGEGLTYFERAHLFPQTTGEPTGPKHVLSLQEATRRFQARFIREAIESNGWNVVETARRLDVARSHLYTLIRGFGIERSNR
jgi:DNA-binding NtrC family response regulator